MDHYLNIRLLPDPEFAPSVLMSALFSKLHRALVQQDSRTIGVSFPDTRQEGTSLGGCLRLHGNSRDLQQLMVQDWLTGMRDHTAVGEIASVPENALHRVVRRVQAKSNPERLRRRLVQRKGITEEEARQFIPDKAVEKLDLPYVIIRSHSTGQSFRLFIDHRPTQVMPVKGEFSAYGLSPAATVPWF